MPRSDSDFQLSSGGPVPGSRAPSPGRARGAGAARPAGWWRGSRRRWRRRAARRSGRRPCAPSDRALEAGLRLLHVEAGEGVEIGIEQVQRQVLEHERRASRSAARRRRCPSARRGRRRCRRRRRRPPGRSARPAPRPGSAAGTASAPRCRAPSPAACSERSCEIERGRHGEAAVGEAGPALVDRQLAEGEAPGRRPARRERRRRRRGDRGAVAGAGGAWRGAEAAPPRPARSRHSIGPRRRGRAAAAAPAAPACRSPRCAPRCRLRASSSSTCSAASSGAFASPSSSLATAIRRASTRSRGAPSPGFQSTVRSVLKAPASGGRSTPLQVGPRHDQRQRRRARPSRSRRRRCPGRRTRACPGPWPRRRRPAPLKTTGASSGQAIAWASKLKSWTASAAGGRGGRVAPVELAGADRQGGEARLPARRRAARRPRRSPPTPLLPRRSPAPRSPRSPRSSAAARAPPAPRRPRASRRRAAGSPGRRRCARASTCGASMSIRASLAIRSSGRRSSIRTLTLPTWSRSLRLGIGHLQVGHADARPRSSQRQLRPLLERQRQVGARRVAGLQPHRQALRQVAEPRPDIEAVEPDLHRRRRRARRTAWRRRPNRSGCRRG